MQKGSIFIAKSIITMMKMIFFLFPLFLSFPASFDASNHAEAAREIGLPHAEFTGGPLVQCNGLTKSGNRCRNNTKNASGYCYLHEKQNTSGSQGIGATEPALPEGRQVQCSAITRKRTQCSRMTRNASGRCYQHEGQ